MSAHEEIRDAVRRFAREQLAPNAARWDRENEFPREALRGLGAMGLYGIAIPEDLGGAGLDYTAMAIACEEIAAGDCATATVVAVNINGTAPFLGPFIAQFLRGGAEIGPDTLSRFYALHMLLIPGALIALIGLHLYLVIRLGVSPNPWTREREEPELEGRSGLTRPSARGVAK